MARPTKGTVDYFPHYIKSGKTLFVLENDYGNDGYTFWFKLLEVLAGTDGMTFDFSDEANVRFLLSKTRIDKEKCLQIIETLVVLGAIDKELWNENGIIWVGNLVENVKDAFKKRINQVPKKPCFAIDEKRVSSINIISAGVNQVLGEFPQVETTQKVHLAEFTEEETGKGKEIKLKESKLNEIKSEEDIPAEEADSKSLDESSIKANDIEKYFCQKRGKGLQVSTDDYKLMQEIAAYGITVESAKLSIDNCFAEYKPKHPRDMISTFSYCVSRCYDDWTKQIEKSKPINIGGDQNGKHGENSQGFKHGRDSSKSVEESITGGQVGWIARNKRIKEVPLPDV
ncbi:MAG: Lin1244/Lin1753 domain-containing protein [Paenibacillaceae bacterium]